MPGIKGFNGTYSSIFGDGSDGDVVITATASLSRDMFYRNLIISGSGLAPELQTNSFRVYVSEKLIFLTSGSISNDGNPAQTGTPGTSPRPSGLSGTLSALGDGGGANSTGSGGFLGLGGNGGNAGGTPNPGPGGIVVITGTDGFTVVGGAGLFESLFGYSWGGPTPLAGGAGGGGGGGASGQGGGGGGGGVLVVAAKHIIVGLSSTFTASTSFTLVQPNLYPLTGTFTGTIVAPSATFTPFTGTVFQHYPGATGSFTAVGGSGGTDTSGGGGGGGGVVLVISSYRSGTLQTNVSGGLGGAPGGSAGSIGNAFFIDIET
ncbi:MAG: hypothetical protein ACYDHY_07510 [Acidiferrobacterales bacterium]